VQSDKYFHTARQATSKIIYRLSQSAGGSGNTVILVLYIESVKD